MVVLDAITEDTGAPEQLRHEARFFAAIAYHQIGDDEATYTRFRMLIWDVAKPWSRYAHKATETGIDFERWLDRLPFDQYRVERAP